MVGNVTSGGRTSSTRRSVFKRKDARRPWQTISFGSQRWAIRGRKEPLKAVWQAVASIKVCAEPGACPPSSKCEDQHATLDGEVQWADRLHVQQQRDLFSGG